MVLLSVLPFGEIAERRASRGLWSRGRERSEKSECVSASVCASALARAVSKVSVNDTFSLLNILRRTKAKSINRYYKR